MRDVLTGHGVTGCGLRVAAQGHRPGDVVPRAGAAGKEGGIGLVVADVVAVVVEPAAPGIGIVDTREAADVGALVSTKWLLDRAEAIAVELALRGGGVARGGLH